MKFEVKRRKVVLATVFLISILLASVGSYFVGAASVASKNIYLNDLPASATYTIKTDGINYWAVKYDGSIPWSSTESVSVSQSVVDALASTGGWIHYGKGTFDFGASNLNIRNSNYKITGEGRATHIIGDTHGKGAFWFNGSSTISNFLVSDIYFSGDVTEAESHGLIFDNSQNMVVENCWFDGIGDECIVLGTTCRNGIIKNNYFNVTSTAGSEQGTPIDLQSGSHIIEGNIIYGGTQDTAAIHLEAITGTEKIESVIIKDNHIFGNNALDVGIYLHPVAFDITNITITGNHIYDVTKGAIIDGLDGSNSVTDILISDNIISGGGSDAAARGAIKITKNTPTGVIITNNIVRNWDATANCIGISTNAPKSVVSNNNVENVGGMGIQIALGANASSVVGNIVSDYDNGGLAAGIVVSANSVSVLGNSFSTGTNAIRLRDSCDYVTITGNSLASGAGGVVNDVSAANVKISGNIGYVTENSGTGVIESYTQGIFAHGLAGTPYHVDISFTNSTATGGCYWTANSANVNVFVGTSGSYTFTWRAYYKP